MGLVCCLGFGDMVVFLTGFLKASGRHTPQYPPLLQYLQPLQFLQAEQYSEPVHFFEQQGLSLWLVVAITELVIKKNSMIKFFLRKE